jgi:hypothetical protein
VPLPRCFKEVRRGKNNVQLHRELVLLCLLQLKTHCGYFFNFRCVCPLNHITVEGNLEFITSILNKKRLGQDIEIFNFLVSSLREHKAE